MNLEHAYSRLGRAPKIKKTASVAALILAWPLRPDVHYWSVNFFLLWDTPDERSSWGKDHEKRVGFYSDRTDKSRYAE